VLAGLDWSEAIETRKEQIIILVGKRKQFGDMSRKDLREI
jgi:hypothetical protein